MLMYIATPQHISYETPSPNLDDENSTRSPEEREDILAADQQKSLEPVDKDADLADDSPLTESMEKSSRPVGVMTVASNFKRTLYVLQQPIISDPMTDPNWEPWSSYHMSSGAIWKSDELLAGVDTLSLAHDNGYPSSDGIFSPLPNLADQINPPDDEVLAMKMLKEDLQVTRQYLERGRHFRAEIEYCMAIQKYVSWGRMQHTKQRAAFTAELVESFHSCTETQEPVTALASLNLPQSSTKTFHKYSVVQSIALPALERLLVGNPGGSKDSFNMQHLAMNLDDSARIPFQRALHLSLKRILPASLQDSLQDPRKGNTEHCRLCLLAFACDLQEFLDKNKPHIGKEIRFYDLREAITRLWDVQSSFQSGSFANSSPVSDIYARFDSAFIRSSDIREEYDRNRYSTIQPLVNELASAASIMGWFIEAEALFTILRSEQSLSIVMRDRKLEISVEYCLHLERQKLWEELLSVLHVAYIDFEKEFQTNKNMAIYNSPRVYKIHRLWNILKRVPSPPDKWVSSDKALEIARVDVLLRNTHPSWPSLRRQDGAVKKDTIEVDSGDEQMDDGKSSHKFGLTYTESVITGISLNYSDLYK
jgi:hypothetical protein